MICPHCHCETNEAPAPWWQRALVTVLASVIAAAITVGAFAGAIVLFEYATANGATIIQPSLPGLPEVPALAQPGWTVTDQPSGLLIQRNLPGLPYPDQAAPALIVPAPRVMPRLDIEPSGDSDD